MKAEMQCMILLTKKTVSVFIFIYINKSKSYENNDVQKFVSFYN